MNILPISNSINVCRRAKTKMCLCVHVCECVSCACLHMCVSVQTHSLFRPFPLVSIIFIPYLCACMFAYVCAFSIREYLLRHEPFIAFQTEPVYLHTIV